MPAPIGARPGAFRIHWRVSSIFCLTIRILVECDLGKTKHAGTVIYADVGSGRCKWLADAGDELRATGFLIAVAVAIAERPYPAFGSTWIEDFGVVGRGKGEGWSESQEGQEKEDELGLHFVRRVNYYLSSFYWV